MKRGTGPQYGEEPGYTLIELLIALSILGLVLVPTSGLFLNSSRWVREGEMRNQALFLARQVLESGNTEIDPHRFYDNFRVEIEDSSFPAGGNKVLNRRVVTVSWGSGTGQRLALEVLTGDVTE